MTKCEHKRLVSTKNRVIDKVYHIQTVNGAIAHYLAWFKETRAKLDKKQILVAAYQYQH